MNTTMQSDLEQRLKNKDFAEEYGKNIAKAEIAVMILQARGNSKLTQEELAKKLDYSQSYIAKVESGNANPTIGNIGKILANMGLRLVATTSDLSSSIEEKGVYNRSANVSSTNIFWPDNENTKALMLLEIASGQFTSKTSTVVFCNTVAGSYVDNAAFEDWQVITKPSSNKRDSGVLTVGVKE